MARTRYHARWVLPIAGSPIDDGTVVVEHDRIAWVGPRAQAPSGGTDDDLGHAVLMPGLVNAHTHLELTVMRGFLEDLAFFDWVRLLAYNVAGCPFWDGEGCVPLAACPTPFADADEDHDVDSADFAAFQRCFNISLTIPPTSLSEECRCFDRNSIKVVGDSVDLAMFISCAGGPDVPWQSSPGCE